MDQPDTEIIWLQVWRIRPDDAYTTIYSVRNQLESVEAALGFIHLLAHLSTGGVCIKTTAFPLKQLISTFNPNIYPLLVEWCAADRRRCLPRIHVGRLAGIIWSIQELIGNQELYSPSQLLHVRKLEAHCRRDEIAQLIQLIGETPLASGNCGGSPFNCQVLKVYAFDFTTDEIHMVLKVG